MVNALMLKSLPYSHPERMGTIYTRITGSRASDERHKLNGEQWELLRDNVPSLISAVSSPGTSGVNLQAGSHAQYVHNGRISVHSLECRYLYRASARPRGRRRGNELSVHHPAARCRDLAGGGCRDQSHLVAP